MSTSIRETKIERGVNPHAEGSAIINSGKTKVLVTASVSTDVPKFLTGTPSGWITAEYGMLPRSTGSRRQRPENRNKPDGRGLEIQRLIARSLRQVAELDYLRSNSITLDCDVLSADAGTRVASINAGTVALVEAMVWMKRKEMIPGVPMKNLVGAMSVALCGGELILDPDYDADSTAEADLNAVFIESGDIVEVQVTGERSALAEDTFIEMVRLARKGAEQVFVKMREAIGPALLGEAGLA